MWPYCVWIMMGIRKVYYIALIFTLLAAPDAVCLDSLRPYMQLEKPKNRPNRRQAILRKNKKKLGYLQNLRKAANESETAVRKVMRENGREKTWNLIETLKQNPSDDLQDIIEFDGLFYLEICTVFDLHEMTKVGRKIIDKNRKISMHSYKDDTPQEGLVRRIAHLAILKELNPSEKEKNILEKYIWLPGEEIEIGLDKYDRWNTIKEYDKGVVYKYLDVSYRFLSQRNMLFSEVISLDPISAFGRGYEHLFNGGMLMNTIRRYIEEKNLVPASEWFNVGRIRHHIVNSNIIEAMKLFRFLVEEYEHKASPAIRQTLRWMHKNGLPDLGQIVKALGMDGICVEEIESAFQVLSDCYIKEIKSLILKKEQDDFGELLVHIYGDNAEAAIRSTKVDIKEFKDKQLTISKLIDSLGTLKFIIAVTKKRTELLLKKQGKSEGVSKELVHRIEKLIKFMSVLDKQLYETKAYFKMRARMEQSVREALDSNGAAKVAI